MNKLKLAGAISAIGLAQFFYVPSALAAVEQCDIDTVMRESHDRIMKGTEDYYEGIEDGIKGGVSSIDVNRGSCSEIIDKLGMLVRMKVPMSFTGMVNNITDMLVAQACKMADQVVTDLVNNFQFGVGDPYGIVDIGIGGSTNGGGSGIQVDEYDIVEKAKDAAIDVITGKMNNASGQVGGGLKDIMSGATDRKRPDVDDTLRKGIDDALKNL